MSLSKKEEELMEFIWKEKEAFFKDIIDQYPEPKPATTTVVTLLKRLQNKKYIDYETFGNSRRYFPLIKKEDYFSEHMRSLIKNSFNNSALQFASFFTSSAEMNDKELEKLKNIVDQELQRRKEK
jgi:BlaI family transcriptional regulator, penicillinase repressor